MESEEEIIRRLEEEYEDTKVIALVQQNGSMPIVEFDKEKLTQNDVIAIIFKSLLTMTMDEYIYEVVSDFLESEEEDGEEEDSEE